MNAFADEISIQVKAFIVNSEFDKISYKLYVMYIMIDNVNDYIRQEVRIELAKRRMRQSELADKIGRSRQQLSTVLQGQGGNVPDIWLEIFNELDFELMPIPKNRIDDVKRTLAV